MISGLTHLHDHCHIIHRDIKPANILHDSWYGWRITDFGLSRNIDESMTRFTGAPLYRAPDLSSTHYDETVDIFSFGLVIVEIMHPFKDINQRLEYFHRLRKLSNSVVDCSDGILSGWKDVAMQMICSDPAERPKSRDILVKGKSICVKVCRSIAATKEISDNRKFLERIPLRLGWRYLVLVSILAIFSLHTFPLFSMNGPSTEWKQISLQDILSNGKETIIDC